MPDIPNEQLDSITRSIEELAARFDKSGKDSDKKKTWTREELSALVGDEKLSQDQADAIMDRQIRDDAISAAESRVDQTLQNRQIKERNQSVIDRYIAANKDIATAGTPIRLQIEREFQGLLDDGMPKTVATERLALERALGPVDAYEQARRASDDDGGGGHEDMTGGGGTDNGGSGKDGDPDTPPSYLTADEKNYYRDLIAKGTYADWSVVHQEMQFASHRVRGLNGAQRNVSKLKKAS